MRQSSCCFDPDGRFITFDFFLDAARFRIVCVYAPAQPSHSTAFYKNLDVHLLDARHCLVLGDFNCVVDSRRDVRGPGYGRTTWNARELRRLIGHFDLVDCWTLLHGTTFEHTWQRGRSSSRLDRVYVTETLASAVQSCGAVDFPPAIGHVSDHRPVLAELSLAPLTGHQRFWRLDSRVLQDPTSRDRLKEGLRRSLLGVTPDPANWDHLLETWRVACVAEGRALRRRQVEELRDTSLRIRIVRRGGAGTPLMRGYLSQLLDRYQRLLRASTTAATVLRGKGGPSSHPEVLRYTHRTQVKERRVPPFPVPSSTPPPGQPSVPSFSSHFEALATSESTIDRATLATHPFLHDLPKVPPTAGDQLFTPPNAEEVHNALLKMKTGSAPGPDGFPTEFYRTFWDVLGEHVCAVLRTFFTELRLPESFRQGRIILLPKEGGDPSDPGAWRPITLLNASYKLLASVLAQRLHDILPDIVTTRQTCSVVGRSIHTLSSLTRDVLHYTNSRSARGLIASLDQAKAFDRVEHPFLFATLDAFGFPPESVRLFEVLYAGMKSDLCIDGSVVASFPVTRGVRQGCPLSPLLFVLSLEPFLTNIDRCSLVRGLPLPGSGEVKASAYADDITLYLRDANDLGAALQVFGTYGSLSGARLNEHKSKALWVNCPPDPASPLPATAIVKILGITYNAMGISPEMWTRLARDIATSVERAREYALPMAERRYLAHSVFCGRLWYVAQVVVPPRNFVRQVRSSLFGFFWMEKTELVTRQVLSLPRERGGWGFPCLDGTPALLQLKTMLMILHEAENPARSLALYFVGHSRRDLGVDLTGPSGACAETPPPAYWKALQLHRHLVEQAPQADITTTPASRLAQTLLEPQLTPVQIGLSDSFPWVRLTSSHLPGHLRDFEWQRGWGVLPTRDRLLRWGVCRTDQCPNCDDRETNVHVVSECVVTRPFWRVVRASFRGLGVALYLLRGRCPSGLFACLLLAASEYVLWRNRCCAAGQGRRLRALWPLLFRLRRELVSHLEAQLFLLGEQEFLRRWSCRYLHVHNSRIELRFQYVDHI